MKGSFFIIPSSVHEVFLLKDNGTHEEKELQSILIRGNHDNFIRGDESLSNHIYRYDKEGQCLEMATRKEQLNEMFKRVELLECLEKITWIEDGEWER